MSESYFFKCISLGCKGQGLHVVGIGVHSCLSKSVREQQRTQCLEAQATSEEMSTLQNDVFNFWDICVGMENIKV